MNKTYIIAHDEYMGEEADIQKRVCTYRELLTNLIGSGPDEDELEKLGIKELEEMFQLHNGDGQPLYVVWSVEDNKRVL